MYLLTFLFIMAFILEFKVLGICFERLLKLQLARAAVELCFIETGVYRSINKISQNPL